MTVRERGNRSSSCCAAAAAAIGETRGCRPVAADEDRAGNNNKNNENNIPSWPLFFSRRSSSKCMHDTCVSCEQQVWHKPHPGPAAVFCSLYRQYRCAKIIRKAGSNGDTPLAPTVTTGQPNSLLLPIWRCLRRFLKRSESASGKEVVFGQCVRARLGLRGPFGFVLFLSQE